MSSSKEFRDFILEQLSDLGCVTCKAMFGEFALYYDGKLFGLICDDRLLVKVTPLSQEYNLPQALPYEGAKPMFLIENLDDRQYLCSLVKRVASSL